MKTVRFQSVIDTAGTPEQHLSWTAPEKDKDLQKALKGDRVMTLHQSAVGNRADYGTIGLAKTAQGQLLIFPKSLAEFAGRRVVGVNYDLFAAAPVKRRPATKPPARKPKPPASAKKKPAKEPAPAKILPFPKPEPDTGEDAKAELAMVRRKVRQALKALEQGRQVAAYEALKTLLP